MSYFDYDREFAKSISDQLNCTGITENAIFPKEKEKRNYRPRTLIDETLEYIDPTPNIYTLFVQFNEKFFSNVLLPVQVKWSPRMTSCAGICTFHPRNKECIISLSTPLLKLRPRKDLIETLLHEMIHAYLFLTNDNRDRDGHGPIFKSHMHRINKEAGTNITVYHDFHEEVKLYQQHWWRCNGPCQNRAPFFGTVRRSMNRAPGPNDFWWKQHQMSCSGQFIKIKEPEKPQSRKKKNSKSPNASTTITKAPSSNNMLNWLKKNDNFKCTQGSITPTKPSQPQIKDWRNTNNESNKNNNPKVNVWNNNKRNSVQNFQTDLQKLGNSTNNVHGWGTGGPSSSTNNYKSKIVNNTPVNKVHPRLSFSGTLGGSGSGKSNLIDKFSNAGKTDKVSNSSIQRYSKNIESSKKSINTLNINSSLDVAVITVICPNCEECVDESIINQHLDVCLNTTNQISSNSSNKKRKGEDSYSSPNKMFKDTNKTSSDSVECPLCSKMLKSDNFNNHLDICIGGDQFDEADVIEINNSSSSINLHESPHQCLICNKHLEPNVTLNEHLEDCVASVFEDSNSDIEDFEKSKINKHQNSDYYPCPICMTLIKESLMNDHLDSCLIKNDV